MTERNDHFIVDGFFHDGIISGFTKRSFQGVLPEDISRLKAILGPGAGISYMNQVHGSDIVTLRGSGVFTCDGMFTAAENSGLVVKTADCMPITVSGSDAKGGVSAGVIHMGWRSARAGILENIPVDVKTARFFLGPGLRRCCYAVGNEFLSISQFAPFLEKRDGRLYFDPVGFILGRLASKGVSPENCHDSGICSYCSNHIVHSFRRGDADTRTLSFIMIKK